MEGRPEIQPEPYYPPTYVPEPVERRPWWKGTLGVLGALALVIVKFGAKFKAVLLLLPIWLFVHVDAAPWLTLAALSALLGAFVERWLFFAQARHLVTLYY